MRRSSMRLGSPAFGWTASGMPPAAGSICSSTSWSVLEPTEQFAPSAWTPRPARLRATSTAERPDRAQHEDAAPGALADVAGEPHAPGVDLAHPIREPVDRELEAVRAEGVRLDAVGPRGDVVGVDRLDDLRLVQVEDVEAGVERHAAGIEHRAHRAVAEERPRVEPAAKRVRHAPAGGPR